MGKVFIGIMFLIPLFGYGQTQTPEEYADYTDFIIETKLDFSEFIFLDYTNMIGETEIDSCAIVDFGNIVYIEVVKKTYIYSEGLEDYMWFENAVLFTFYKDKLILLNTYELGLEGKTQYSYYIKDKKTMFGRSEYFHLGDSQGKSDVSELPNLTNYIDLGYKWFKMYDNTPSFDALK